MLRLRFVRLKHGRYRLEVTRPDGSTTARDLAEGYLAHDLMHLAWERGVGAGRSFYGQLADGRSLDPAETRPFDAGTTDEGLVTEVIVGTLHSAIAHAAQPDLLVARARAMLEVQGIAVPAELRADLVELVLADFRSLAGRFGDLPLGAALEVDFDPRAPR